MPSAHLVPLSPARRRVALGAALVAVLLLAANTLYRSGLGGKERTDLPVYLVAAAKLTAGEDPLGAESGRGFPYLYPPTLAALVAPLLPLPLPVAALAWLALGIGCLAAGVVATRRVASAAPLDRWDALALALILVPSVSALVRGQVGPLLLALCGGAMLLLARGRDATAGLLVALAAAVKVTPAALIGALLLARRWRAVGAAAAALVALLVLLPAPWLGVAGAARATERALRLVEGMAQDPGAIDTAAVADPARRARRHDPHTPTNQSLGSQLARRLTPGPARTGLILGLGAVLVAVALPLAARGAWVESMALLLAAPLIAAPVAWHHHHVVLLPALLLLADRARGGDRLARGALATFGALSLLHFAVGPLRPLGLMGYGTLAVFAALAWRAWPAPSPLSAGPSTPGPAPA